MPKEPELFSEFATAPEVTLCITLDYAGACISIQWQEGWDGPVVAHVRITCTGLNEVTWEVKKPLNLPSQKSSLHRSSIRARANFFRKSFPTLTQLACG